MCALALLGGSRAAEHAVRLGLEQLGSRATERGALELGDLTYGVRGFRVERLALRDADGRALVVADRLIADWTLGRLLHGELRIPHLRLEGLGVDLTTQSDGVTDLQRLLGGPRAGSGSFRLPIALSLPDVQLVGAHATLRSADGDVITLTDGAVSGGIEGRGARLAVSDLEGRFTFTGAHGSVGAELGGDLVYDDPIGLTVADLRAEIPGGIVVANGTFGADVSLGVRVDTLDGAALAPFVGERGLGGRWLGAAAMHGTGRQFELSASMRSAEEDAGSVVLAGQVDRTGAVTRWDADATVSHLRVERLYTPLSQGVEVDGQLELHGSGLALATATADGRFVGGRQVWYGETVDAVDATLSLAGGVIHVTDASLDGIVGALAVSGDVDLTGGSIALDVSGRLSPERLAARGVEGLTGDGTVEAQITADTRASPLVVTVDGVVTYAPFRYPNVELARLSAPFHAVAIEGRVDGTADVRGTGLTALGVTGAGLTGDGVRFAVRDDRVTAAGPVVLEQLAYGDLATVALAEASFTFESRDDHVAIDAVAALSSWTTAGLPGTDGSLGVEVRDDRTTFAVALDDSAGGRSRRALDTTGRFDAASAALALDTLEWSPSPRATWKLAGPAEMTVTDGGVADAELALSSTLGEVSLRGRIGSEGPLDARIGVRALSLDHLAELWPETFDGLAGQLDLDLELSGDAADPSGEAQVSVAGLFVDGQVRWLDLAGPVVFGGGVVSPALALSVAGDPLGHLRGEIPITGRAVDPDRPAALTLALTPGALDRLTHLAPALDDTEVPPGVFSAVVSVDDTLRDPVIHLAGVTELAVGEWASPGRVEFELTRRASELAYSADLREGVATRALIRGTGATAIGSGFSWAFDGGEAPDWSDPELYLNAIEASAVLVGVPAHSLLAAAGVDAPVSGDLVGGVAVSGSPTRPTFDGALNWLDPQIGDQPLTGAYLSFVPRDGAADRVVASAGSVPWTAPGYAVDLQLAFPDGGVQVQGDVPVAVDFDLDREQWVTGDLALDVSGAGVPLALLSAVDPRLRDARGQVIVAGKIGGTPVAPVPDLTATLTDGRVELVPLGVEAHDIDLALSVVDHVVTLDRADVVLLPSRRFQPVGLVSEATALVEGERPRVSITGRAELGLDGLPGRIDGAITLADGAWLSSTADATVRADGEVTVAGQWPALAIDGDVSVGYARIVLDAAALTEGTPLTLDPSLVVVRTGVAPTPSATAEPPLYSAFDVDLALDLNRNLELAMTVPFVEDLGALGAELSRADIATRLGGQLRVEVRGDAPVLVGQLDVVEGSVRMLRSSLALDEGSITFAGGDPYEDALLDLHGSMVVSGGTLEVAIAGSPESPTFTPSSEAYPDQTEQLAILLTGQAPDELSANQGDAVTRMVAQTVLASLLSGQSIGTLTIEPDNSVRLGVPLSPSMYASTLVRPMIVDPNQNLLAVQLEWSLAPRLVVSGGLGDQMGWGDLFWEVRF